MEQGRLSPERLRSGTESWRESKLEAEERLKVSEKLQETGEKKGKE